MALQTSLLSLLPLGRPQATQKPWQSTQTGQMGVGPRWELSGASKPSDEARNVAAARRGEEAGYTALLARHRDRAVRLAAHVLRRSSDAEDAAQEAFLRAFRSLHTLRDPERFGPWLLRIVVRVCVERLARPETGDGALDPTHAEYLAAPRDDADTRLLVTALLDELTPPLRAALVLREVEGLSYDDIAQVLGLPVGTVRSRLSAARARFRALYEAAQKETNDV